MPGAVGRAPARQAAQEGIPQIGDTQTIFYTIDVGHTQTHGGARGRKVGLDLTWSVIPPESFPPGPTPNARKDYHAADYTSVYDHLLHHRLDDPRR